MTLKEFIICFTDYLIREHVLIDTSLLPNVIYPQRIRCNELLQDTREKYLKLQNFKVSHITSCLRSETYDNNIRYDSYIVIYVV